MMHESKEAFFESMESYGLALTFDDVRLRTARSEVPPAEIDLSSRFSRNVELNTPFASAAMDTVTTSEMAIAMAKLGGIGVIHAGLDIEAQHEEVRRVKLHLNGLIENPVTVRHDQSLMDVLNEQFDFHTFPVVNTQNRFVGLLTKNDFDFADDLSQRVMEAMTPRGEVMTASAQVSVKEAHDLMRERKKKTLPLINGDGTVAGLYIFSDVSRIVRGDAALYNVDAEGRLRTAAAVPTDEEALDRVREMYKYLDVAVIDTSQGDSNFAFTTLEMLKNEFPNLDVVVGNISEAASARELAEAGADGIKVGQGPGSICTTRVETGIGCPQVTALYECSKALEEYNVPVCADGGIRYNGDISIAIAAGAHSVMMGRKLAGTRETPGEILRIEEGKMVKLYRGMGSPSALRESAAARKRYGQRIDSEPLPEGIETRVPYAGSVIEVIGQAVKALRKSMAYVGAESIEDHRQNTLFWRVTNAGITESHPHDID